MPEQAGSPSAPPPPRDPQRPQVVAHRGSSETNAEHTLGAYLAALDEGADALECDVRLTADGHLVCVHDRDLRRTTHTEGVVSTSNLEELEQLDFATWKHPWAELDDEALELDPEKGRVLTLRRLLETVADYPRPVQVAIETKHPTRFAGLVERRLVELLDEFGWADADSPARIMSFSWVALRRVRRRNPHLPLVLLMDRAGQWLQTRPVAEPDWIAGPGIKVVRKHPELIRDLRRQDVRVHCWTVNKASDVERCVQLGIESLITDRPRHVLRHLGQLKR